MSEKKMENRRRKLRLMVAMITSFMYVGKVTCRSSVSGSGSSYETPKYEVVRSESEYEIRLYGDTVWMVAPVNAPFEKATRNGYHRLFQYIQGANLNFSRLSMTVPVLTSIVPGAGPLAYSVNFYLPVKFQVTPPLPLLELNLKPDSWTSRCIAVRKFSGFARDKNIVKEAEKLAISLSTSPWANHTSSKNEYAYSIAQYSSPFQFIKRVNEVWLDVTGCEADGSQFNQIAAF